MSHKTPKWIPVILAGLIFTILQTFNGFGGNSSRSAVLGTSTESSSSIENKVTLNTKSAFIQKDIAENEPISFDKEYKDDPETEYGEEKILTKGKEGNKKTTYVVTYWFDTELYRNVSGVEITKPQTEVISRGTKIVWRTIQTEVGSVKYWRKMKVWATKYDRNCYGCRGLTYSGTLVRKGVCAVDPKTVPLGTTFYVEGYGMCHAEDIGGAIKGNKIDLGFEDAAKGAWGAAYTNIYLITSVPGTY